MYAIVEIKGQQFKAEAGKFVYVRERLSGIAIEYSRQKARIIRGC